MASSVVAFVSIDGGAKIDVSGFVAIERISQIPTFKVEIERAVGGVEKFLGKPAVITLPEYSTPSPIDAREFSGLVVEAEIVKDDSNANSEQVGIRLEIKPFLALLGYSIYSAVYQNKSSIDILKEVLKRNGMSRAQLKITATPPKRDMCIQYNENDLDFIQRLLADDGIIFYFNDGGTAECMVLHDSSRKFPKNKHCDANLVSASKINVELFRADNLSLGRQLVAGKVTLTSYDVAKAAQQVGGPSVSRRTKLPTTNDITSYITIPATTIKDSSEKMAQQIKSYEQRLTGYTTHPALFVGQTLEIDSDKNDQTGGTYIISEIEFRAQLGSTTTQFCAGPKSAPHQSRLMPKPLISGLHNALVVGGPAGSVACDGEGRVKVKFIWDMCSEKKDTTAWLRVAENMAGVGYGSQFIPRVGSEVLVSFLHGDPDAPVIIGSVYNGKNKHPYMSANTTKSGFMTKLKANANEVIFDDKEKSELLALRAAKDYELSVAGNATRTIKKDETNTVEGKSKLHVKDTLDMDVSNAMSLDADKITLTGKNELTLKVGGSSVKLTSTGISIKASQVSIEATKFEANGSASFKLSGGKGDVEASGPLSLKGLQLKAEGGAQAEIKGGAMLSLKGGAMVQVQGGLVKIN